MRTRKHTHTQNSSFLFKYYSHKVLEIQRGGASLNIFRANPRSTSSKHVTRVSRKNREKERQRGKGAGEMLKIHAERTKDVSFPLQNIILEIRRHRACDARAAKNLVACEIEMRP